MNFGITGLLLAFIGCFFCEPFAAANHKYEGVVYLKDGSTYAGHLKLRENKILLYDSDGKGGDFIPNARIDSMRLTWDWNLKEFKFIYLLRKTRHVLFRVEYDGVIGLGFNYFQTGEKMNDLKDWYVLFKKDGTYREISWSALEWAFPDQQYIRELHKALFKYRSSLPNLFLIYWTLEIRQPISVLSWDSLELHLSDGTVRKGVGCPQYYIEDNHMTNQDAYFHFFEHNRFELFDQTEIDFAQDKKGIFRSFYFANQFRYAFAREWRYQGVIYQIIFCNNDPKFSISGTVSNPYREEDFIFTVQSEKGRVRRVNDQKALFEAYIAELKSRQRTNDNALSE